MEINKMADAPKQEVIVEGRPLNSAPATPTKEFRLRQGKSHTHGGHAVHPGDVVHLTAVQAQAFRDKFDAVNPDASFKEAKPDVHHEFTRKATNRMGTSNSGEDQSTESQRAQADKATAESKASTGAGTPNNTFDTHQGTIQKDPGPTEPGQTSPAGVTPPAAIGDQAAKQRGEDDTKKK